MSDQFHTPQDDDDAVPNVVISRSTQRIPQHLQPKAQDPNPAGYGVSDTPPPAPAAPAPQLSEGPATSAAASSDPTAVTVFLPSKGMFYDFTTLAIKPVRGYHQSKFSRAAKEKLTRHIVEAVTTLLPDGVDAMDLTVPDFYFLLYWLRLNCYTKAQLVHRGVCQHHDHVRKVREGELKPESLVTLVTIGKTSLKQTEIDPNYLEGFIPDAQLDASGLDLYPLRMRDVVDMEENLSDSENFIEVEYIADLASFVRVRAQPNASLTDRCKLVENLSPDALESIAEYRDRVSNYGVEELLNFTCQECRAGNETVVSISAHSFL